MINKLFSFFLLQTLFIFADPTWEVYKQEALKRQQLITGWCSPQKALLLMDVIHLLKPLTCVEIGTFSGSSSYPIIKALAYNQRGILHTIDTWHYSPKTENLSDYNQHANFWEKTAFDGDAIYLEFIAKQFGENLRAYCNPMRINSLKAAQLFPSQSIDFLYLDGSFEPEFAMQELLTYFPKVKTNGYIYLNKADLEAKHKLVQFLMDTCQYEKNGSFGIECVLFMKK